MMRLKLMCSFFRTVDSSWHSPVAQDIACAWPVLDSAPVVWRASANFVCGATAGGKQYALRFNHASERTAAWNNAEVAFIRHAARQGVPVAQPVELPGGGFTASVETQLGVFHAVLFEYLPGKHDEFAELDDAAWFEWGAALGRLHRASAGCTPLPRPSWRSHIAFARQHLPAGQAALQRELDFVEHELSGFRQDSLGYGLVHFDFERDNLKRTDAGLAALDFDDCAYYWFEADIAFALRDLFNDSPAGIDLAGGRLKQFAQGYRTAYTLSDAALKRLPLFLRLHNLYSCARNARALGDGPGADEPEWAIGLREKLCRINAGYLRDCEERPLAQ